MSICFASQWWPIYTILLLNVNKCKIKPDRSLLERLKAQHYIDSFIKIEYVSSFNIATKPWKMWNFRNESFNIIVSMRENMCQIRWEFSAKGFIEFYGFHTIQLCLRRKWCKYVTWDKASALCVCMYYTHSKYIQHMCCATRARYLMKWNYLFMHHYIFNHIAHWIQLNIHVIHLATVVIFSILS